MKQVNIYSELAAEAYKYWYPVRDDAELNFYLNFIKQAGQGGALEVACGSGQLMIPYIKAGYNVEGFDASEAMLKIARAEAKKAGVKITLYCQKMEELNIGKTYSLLYAPFGALHHLASPELAAKALKHFYEHTSPGGTLLLHLLSPLKVNLTQAWQQTHQAVRAEDGAVITTCGKSDYNKAQKFLTSHYRVDINKNGKVLEKGEWVDYLQFYSDTEITVMLEQAGYKVVNIHNSYTTPEEESTKIMIVEAIKS